MCIIQKYYYLPKHPQIKIFCGGYGGGGFLKKLKNIRTIRD